MTETKQDYNRSSFKQTMKLLYIQMLQYMSINEVLHSKDKKKKNGLIALMAAYALTGLMLVSYMAGGAYALCFIGAAEFVPAYVLSITSIVILVFSLFKAGSVLFQVKNYEMLITLPIKPTVIVVSRLLNMYMGNLLLSILTMIPSGFIYSMFVPVGASFYIMFFLSIFLLPLVPITIASIIGAVVTAIGSRMRHKNGVMIILLMALTIGVLILSFMPLLAPDKMNMQQVNDLAQMVKEQVNGMYPLAALYTEAVVNGNILAFVGFAGISVGIFALFAVIVQRKYAAICAALLTHAAKKNYKMGKQSQGKVVTALFKKEWKRYFSSSIYVMNTLIGHVMMIGMSIALLCLGIAKIEEMFMIEGAAEQIRKLLPMIYALMGMLAATTPSSISLEGKQWWIPKSLPLTTKQIFDSKILLSLSLAIPSCAVTAIISAIALKLDIVGLLWMFLIPSAYCLFAAVVGIAFNIKFPNFTWDNEVRVVKQGAATFMTMLTEFAVGFAGIGLIFLLGALSYHIVMAIILFILLLAGAVIYKKIINYDLRKLN